VAQSIIGIGYIGSFADFFGYAMDKGHSFAEYEF